MATKREIDKLLADIPKNVAAAHAAREQPEAKSKPDVEGPFAGDIICPSDYGFDMFGEEGADYIRERSKEIARQSLKVHGIEPVGVSHASTKGTAPKTMEEEDENLGKLFEKEEFGPARKNAPEETESTGRAAKSKPARQLSTHEKFGSTQEED